MSVYFAPVAMDILAAIGNTSIVRLRHVVPPNCADVLAVVTLMADSGLKYLGTDVFAPS